MSYYAYMAGFCRYCGTDLGLIDQAGGRYRQYCNDAHKQAAHRKRKDEAKRNTILLRNKAMSEYWQENAITGEILARLQNMLIEHGKEAARKATDLVILAKQAERDAGTAEHTSLLEQVMLYGEACILCEVTDCRLKGLKIEG